MAQKPSQSNSSSASPRSQTKKTTSNKTAEAKQLAKNELWRQGKLRYLLDSNQQEIYDRFYACLGRKFVLCCSRRLGKSFLLAVLAIEHALRIPNAQVKYAAPTQRQVKRIIFPIFRQLLQDCPEDLKPEWFAQESTWEFPNGSQIAIAGMDAGRADALRGTDAHFACVDEAAFSPSHHVQEMIGGVLLPMSLLTGGKIVIASTPAKTPRHAFEQYYVEALKEGNAVHKTIFDNPRLSPKMLQEAIKESGGEETTYFKREYLAQFIIDDEVITLPEFTPEAQAAIVKLHDRPAHFDAYTSMDVGMKDATGVLFFYWDFLGGKLVVEDEALLQGVKEVRTDLIADIIRTKEEALWKTQRPYFRVCDADPVLINDLDGLHGIRFIKAERESKEVCVNELRLLIQTRQLVVHPRCKQLIAQLAACVWDSKRESFERIDGYHHFDLVDALIYGMRSVRRNHNPYPNTHQHDPSKFYNRKPASTSMTGLIIKNLFAPKFGRN